MLSTVDRPQAFSGRTISTLGRRAVFCSSARIEMPRPGTMAPPRYSCLELTASTVVARTARSSRSAARSGSPPATASTSTRRAGFRSSICRLGSELAAYVGDEVVVLPAWETLPFERVSPGVEVMGRRLRAMWKLGHPDRSPRVLVAPVRALIQRLYHRQLSRNRQTTHQPVALV